MISNTTLKETLHTLFTANAGFYFGFGTILEIGQFENRTFWVEHKSIETKDEKVLFYEEYEDVNSAIDRFILLRDTYGIGYDWEEKLNRDSE